jgi:hypothetical protein
MTLGETFTAGAESLSAGHALDGLRGKREGPDASASPSNAAAGFCPGKAAILIEVRSRLQTEDEAIETDLL